MKNHLIARYAIAVAVALVVIVGGVMTGYYAGLFTPEEVSFKAKETQILGFAMSGDQYLDRAQNGTRVGEQIQPVTLINSEGQEISLFAGKKKVLLAYGIPGCSSCKDYYPILRDWAKRYKDQLTVVLVYQGEPEEAEIAEHVAAGIEVILDSSQLRGRVDAGSKFWSLLIAEDGRVEGRFSFEVYRWEEYYGLVQRFASGIWEPMSEQEIQLGQVLKLPPMKDFRGRLFQLEDYRGKPTVLFVVSPGCQTCTLTYQFVSYLRATYEERLNLVVVMNYSTREMWNKITSYRNRYKLSNADEVSDVQTPEELVKGQGLENVPLFFDAEHSVFSNLKAWIIPTMLVLDRDGVLVDICGLGVARGENPETLDILMEQMLLNLW